MKCLAFFQAGVAYTCKKHLDLHNQFLQHPNYFSLFTITPLALKLNRLGSRIFNILCLGTTTTSICRQIDCEEIFRSHMVGGKLVENSSPSQKVVVSSSSSVLYVWIHIKMLVLICKKNVHWGVQKARIKICSKSWVSTPFVWDSNDDARWQEIYRKSIVCIVARDVSPTKNCTRLLCVLWNMMSSSFLI